VHLYFLLLTRKYDKFAYFHAGLITTLQNHSRRNLPHCSSTLLIQETVRARCDALRDGEIDSIFVPMHVSDHWALGVISGDGTFCVYDSLANETFLKVAIHQMLDWLQNEFQEIDWQYKFVIDKPQLQDRFNCAISIFVYAEFLCNSQTNLFSLMNQTNLNQHRDIILLRLFQGYQMVIPSLPSSSSLTPSYTSLKLKPSLLNLQFQHPQPEEHPSVEDILFVINDCDPQSIDEQILFNP